MASTGVLPHISLRLLIMIRVFLDAVLEGNIVCGGSIKEYLSQTGVKAASQAIFVRMSWWILEFLDKDFAFGDFAVEDLESLQEDLRTSKQGVYLAIVCVSGTFWRYVGSSWGQAGLENRVFNNHLSMFYRMAEPDKALYQKMEEAAAATWFLPLAIYPETVSKYQILLHEAFCACLFGAYNVRQYAELAFAWRPNVDWTTGLNRSNPIGMAPTADPDSAQGILSRREARRQWYLLAGPFTAINMSREATARSRKIDWWYMNLFHCRVYISKAIAMAFNLYEQEAPILYVRWDVEETPVHPHQWAIKANAGDDGARLAIRVFRDRAARDHDDGVWMTNNSAPMVALANTIVDLLEGRLLAPDYTPPAGRVNLFSSGSVYASANPRRRRRHLNRGANAGTLLGNNTN